MNNTQTYSIRTGPHIHTYSITRNIYTNYLVFFMLVVSCDIVLIQIGKVLYTSMHMVLNVYVLCVDVTRKNMSIHVLYSQDIEGNIL